MNYNQSEKSWLASQASLQARSDGLRWGGGGHVTGRRPLTLSPCKSRRPSSKLTFYLLDVKSNIFNIIITIDNQQSRLNLFSYNSRPRQLCYGLMKCRTRPTLISLYDLSVYDTLIQDYSLQVYRYRHTRIIYKLPTFFIKSLIFSKTHTSCMWQYFVELSQV